MQSGGIGSLALRMQELHDHSVCGHTVPRDSRRRKAVCAHAVENKLPRPRSKGSLRIRRTFWALRRVSSHFVTGELGACAPAALHPRRAGGAQWRAGFVLRAGRSCRFLTRPARTARKQQRLGFARIFRLQRVGPPNTSSFLPRRPAARQRS